MGRLKQLAALMEHPHSVAALFSWPCFSLTSFQVVSILRKKGVAPKTVIDVGANVGQFAVAAAKLFGDVTVHSFEPIPAVFEQLCRNTAGLGNVKTYSLALGDQVGTKRIQINANLVSSSMLDLATAHLEAFVGARVVDAPEVTTSTLDSVFEGQDLPRPLLLKLDVQGYEAHVIRGAHDTMRRCDYLLLETSFIPLYHGETPFIELAAILEKEGFQIQAVVGSLESPKTGEILQVDALFCRSDGWPTSRD
jgi:FkbM family methyltransferase